jgi:DNA/RNA-binding domain of Phe-tRNA-synthetase-like protein
MEVKNIQVSDSLEGIARVGIAFLKQVANGPVASRLREQMESLADELRRTLAGRPLAEVEAVARIRRLYHALGIDPTKDRPGSERLLRRVLRKKPLPKINKLVDGVHLVSLRLQCPISVYDWDRVVPPVLVRIGQPGERFRIISHEAPSTEPHTEDWLGLQGRLVLVDGEGPFGNPSHDSARTQVTLGTVRAMVVAWAPSDAPKSFLESVLDEVCQVSEEYSNTRLVGRAIL